MNRSLGGWRGITIGLISVALVVAGCGSAAGASDKAAAREPTPNVKANGQAAAPSNESDRYLMVNVDMTDDGYEPSSVYLPVGRGVKFIVRNRGTTEHHYRVVGLVPKDLEWLVPLGDEPIPLGDTADDHDLHHPSGFAPYRDSSPHGIKPLGDEVHAYAAAGALDAVLFVPTNTGTFPVQDPLHPKMAGKMVVY